jgi:hypothetical protein
MYRVSSGNYEPLRRSLGCPPDEIEVYEGGGLDSKHRFSALFRLRMCQKRLRIQQNVSADFFFFFLIPISVPIESTTL